MIPVPLAFLTPQIAIVVIVVLLLLFGAKKLPELARGLRQAIREFSKGKNDAQDDPSAEAARQIPSQNTAQTKPATNTEPVPVKKDNAG